MVQNVLHLRAKPGRVRMSGNLQFSFQTSTLLFCLTFLHPSFSPSLRLMADIKFCSAAKSQVNLRLKLHGCLYEALIYPRRGRGMEAIEHISNVFLPLYERLSALEFLHLTVFERCLLMYAVNINSSHKDEPSPTLDCLSLCPALSTFSL